MLDIKFIRENLGLVKEGIRKKNVNLDLDSFIILDDKRRELQKVLEKEKARLNKISLEISILRDSEKDERLVESRDIKKGVQKIEEEIKPILEEWHKILMEIPNPPSSKMPEGKDDSDNITIKTWGEIPKFNFKPRDHIEIGKLLDIIDIEKASEISGSRFFYLKNDAVLMQFAIVDLVFKTLTNEAIIEKLIKENNLSLSSKPFVPMLPPVMIRHDVQKAIHRVFGDQTYRLPEDNLNLVASAEHTMAPYHMNEVLKEEDLPKRYIGYSTSFRRESGTYGKDMGGILRTHQFDKLEMESFTNAETGEEEQLLMVAVQEYLVQQLKIPYRLQQVCTGDTGKPDYNQFDIECWIPSQNLYRETHTSDYMTDYQTRGINSRYKTRDGKYKFLYTNDATAFAIGRILIAIIENYQQEDGSIKIPDILTNYIGKNKIV
ncbi:MAG: serine--tRNA ligase [Candidatus Pacebacteria bacterium]|nr:serine--tRNA ligase [Candidatus Paceibacterota bacterium]